MDLVKEKQWQAKNDDWYITVVHLPKVDFLASPGQLFSVGKQLKVKVECVGSWLGVIN